MKFQKILVFIVLLLSVVSAYYVDDSSMEDWSVEADNDRVFKCLLEALKGLVKCLVKKDLTEDNSNDNNNWDHSSVNDDESKPGKCILEAIKTFVKCMTGPSVGTAMTEKLSGLEDIMSQWQIYKDYVDNMRNRRDFLY